MQYNYIYSNANSITITVLLLAIILFLVGFMIKAIVIYRRARENGSISKDDLMQTIIVCCLCILLIVFVAIAGFKKFRVYSTAVYLVSTRQYENISGKAEIISYKVGEYGRNNLILYSVVIEIEGHKLIPSNSFTEEEILAITHSDKINIGYSTNPAFFEGTEMVDSNGICYECNCLILVYSIIP